MFLTMYPRYLVPVVIGITGIDELFKHPFIKIFVVLVMLFTKQSFQTPLFVTL